MHKMKLIITSFLASFLFLTASVNANECTSTEITLDSTVSADWTTDCNSTHRPDTYAKYYTFTLDNPKTVVINLDSEVDTYLYLLPDSNQSSNPIAENDDYNGLNSQIIMDLSAGTYTIEATTFNIGELGVFTLSLAEATVTEFKGKVTLPSSITDLLNDCSAEECPSISVNMNSTDGMIREGTYVDYNDSSTFYEYQLTVIGEAGADTSYTMEMYIENGDMGSESLVYSFGSDNQVGGTDDAVDVMYHWDEVWNGEIPIVVEPLLVSADIDTVVVDLDFTNKNVGRHKVTGKIHLPLDINMSDSVEEDGYLYYINDLYVNIEGSNTWAWATVNRIAEGGNNDYSFVTSIPHNLPEPSKLSIGVNGRLYNHQIQATYKVPPADKFVSGWLDSSENYIEFNQTVADFGTMDMAVFLDGYELLTGSVKAPSNLITRGTDRSMSLSVHGNTFNGYSYIDLYDYNESAPPQFSILIPGSEKETIKTEGLKFSVYFDWYDNNNGTNGYFYSYYTFGEDKAIGGTGVNEDHLLEGCINESDATPLVVSTSTLYPIVDINLSNYAVPYTFKITGTLPVPSTIEYLDLWSSTTDCSNSVVNSYAWSWDNGDGTWSYEINSLLDSSTYAIRVQYSETSNPDIWYEYVLNDTDMDLTTEGVFLDEIHYDENGQIIYPDPLATITGSADEEIAIAPFEFILPASSNAVSPAVIMYLLN